MASAPISLRENTSSMKSCGLKKGMSGKSQRKNFVLRILTCRLRPWCGGNGRMPRLKTPIAGVAKLVGLLRIWIWGPLYYNFNLEPPT